MASQSFRVESASAGKFSIWVAGFEFFSELAPQASILPFFQCLLAMPVLY
jgi:hypothetical protein